MKKELLIAATFILALLCSCGKGLTELHETVLIDGSVGKLAGDIDRPAYGGKTIPVCIYFHGLTGNRSEDQIMTAVDSLQANGVATVRFDFNGHGESEGDFVNMDLNNELQDAELIYDYVASLPWVNKNKIVIAGHSQGGLIASLLAAKLGEEKIKCAVLYAPAANIPFDVRTGSMFGCDFDINDLPEYIPFWKGTHLGKNYLQSALDLQDIFTKAADYEGPVRVIQGMNDSPTLMRNAANYRRALKNCEFIPLQGVTHCFPEALDTQAHLGTEFIKGIIDAPLSIEGEIEDDWVFVGEGTKTLNLKLSAGNDNRTNIEVNFVKDTTLTLPVQDTVYTFAKTNIKVKGGVPTFLPLHFDLKPGFYQVRIGYSDSGERKEAPAFMIGVNPEGIQSPQDKQPDFDSFWEETLAELAKIPMKPELTLLPEYSDTNRNVFRVEMKSLGGAVFGGILAEPVKPGKYPAYIQYQGYSENPSYYRGGARPGVIEFHVSVREQGLYKDASPMKDHWMEFGLDSKESYYYRGAYCDVKRAVEFIASRERTDQSRIFASGDSQGAGFSMVAASLDDRIRAIAIGVPFLGDFADYWKVVEWPMQGVFDAGAELGLSKDEILKTLTYFDAKNLVDRIKCDVYMGFCVQDPTCPPHTNFGSYNQIKSKKEYFGVAEGKHDIWGRQVWNEGKKEFFGRFN